MSPPDETSTRGLRRLRAYTFFTVIGTGPIVLFMAGVFLAASGLSGVALAVAGAAAAASTGLCTAALALHWHGRGRMRRRVLWAASLVALVAGAVVEARAGRLEGAWAAPAGMLAAELALWSRPGRRARSLALACGVAVGAVAVLARLDLFSPAGVVVSVLMVPTIGTAIVCQLWHYQIASELEQARGLAAELAVAQERLRFAGELHDVQGGNLQAITLKAQVARRLAAVDPERAEAEMRAVEELARTALQDTREVVGGYRKVALADEIDSAARILHSAGVQATVPDTAPSLDADTEKLLGLLVREATTNLIRHAQPTAADMTIAETEAEVSVTVTNNGATSSAGGGNGLTMLTDRFAEAGGNVEHRRDGDRFTLRGTVPKPRRTRPPAPSQAKRTAGSAKRGEQEGPRDSPLRRRFRLRGRR